MVGGFGAHPGHDPHILNTISAVQIMAIVDALDEIDGDKIARCEFPPLTSGIFSWYLKTHRIMKEQT